MPLGVNNAPAVFEEMMQTLFGDCICSPYMDDLVIFSPCWEDHVSYVRQVLDKLKSAGLTANSAKCHWGGTRMEFLGHLVGEGTMSVPQHRVELLASYTKPTTKKGLRAFLGSVGFYQHYLELLVEHTAVVTPLISSWLPPGLSGPSSVSRTSICTYIAKCCSLCIPLSEGVFSVVTDSPQVWRDGRWEAAAFHSRQLRGAE